LFWKYSSKVGAKEKWWTRGRNIHLGASDFDTRHFWYKEEESYIIIHDPNPIPKVITALGHCLGDNSSNKCGAFGGNLPEWGFSNCFGTPAVPATQICLKITTSPSEKKPAASRLP
jgi:hypothetical protein